MKPFFRWPAVVLALCLCLCSVAFADEPEDPPVTDGPPISEPDTDVEFPPFVFDSSSVTCSGADVTINLDDRSYTSSADLNAPPADSDIAVLGDIPPSITAVLRSLFGEYTPKTQTVTTYFDGQVIDTTTEIIPGVAGMDFEWLTSVALFGIVLFCLFKLLGGILK